MNKETYDTRKSIVYKAISSLERYTNMPIELKDDKLRKGQFLIIANEKFVIQARTDISKGNKGIILSQSKEFSQKSKLPVIIIAKYIPSEIAKEYTQEGLNYLDIAGNCNIRENTLFIQLEGKKTEKTTKVNQSRAFQETGIKIIFHLLSNPDNLNLTYRQIAELAEVSLGSVGSVMQELTDLHFILKAKTKKVLKNKPELLERWVIAYHDVLRSRLVIRKMRFSKKENYSHWAEIPIQEANQSVLWGGEPAAALLTKHLSPGNFTIYTTEPWQSLGKIGLVPSDDGNIEVLRMFWKGENQFNNLPIVPPLLIYADLMGSGYGRNIETAKIILENDLQHIR